MYGEIAAHVRGEALDASVRRTQRVLIVRPEGNATLAQAQRRAQWEAKVRAGRAVSATVTVTGWQQASGAVWPVNALVPVRSPTAGIDGEMLITQATHVRSASGTTTVLSLARPDAFLPEAVVTKKGENWRWAELNR
jgi:prophage tail gpP-like protein